MGRTERDRDRSLHLVSDRDLLWRVDDPADDLLVGLIASTEHLTAGRASLLPGQRSMVRSHGGDLAMVVLAGAIGLFVPDAVEPPSWFELGVGDAFYAPIGSRYQCFAYGSDPADVLFGVASAYLSELAPGAGAD